MVKYEPMDFNQDNENDESQSGDDYLSKLQNNNSNLDNQNDNTDNNQQSDSSNSNNYTGSDQNFQEEPNSDDTENQNTDQTSNSDNTENNNSDTKQNDVKSTKKKKNTQKSNKKDLSIDEYLDNVIKAKKGTKSNKTIIPPSNENNPPQNQYNPEIDEQSSLNQNNINQNNPQNNQNEVLNQPMLDQQFYNEQQDNYPNQAQPDNQNQNVHKRFGINKEINKINEVNPKIIKPNLKYNSAGKKKLIIFIIVIIALIAIVGAGVILLHHPKKVVTKVPVSAPKFHYINSCQSIIKSGVYYLGTDLTYSGTSGSCINIRASNVSFICKNKGITGSEGNSNGVLISNENNVSVEGCSITKFAYGININDSNNSIISFNNISDNLISSINLKGGKNNYVLNNTIIGSGEKYGAIYLYDNASNNTISQNKVLGSDNVSIYIDSAGNKIYENTINDTPYAFYCNVNYGLPSSNLAYANSCYKNIGCDFEECSVLNIPDNVSKITLSPKIYTCGSINSPGNYTMMDNITAGYLNINYTSPYGVVNKSLLYYPKCITITKPNVTLNCNNYSIYDSDEGINIFGLKNVSLENCNLNGDSKAINDSFSNYTVMKNIQISNSTNYGINFASSYNGTISNVSISNSSDGIYLFAGSEYNVFYNISLKNNQYGVFLNYSNLNIFNNFKIKNNSYGVFFKSSLYNTFNNGNITNNSVIDLYAEPDSIANKTTNIFDSTTCGLSDTKWGVCKYYVLPKLNIYPINSCLNITRSGNYVLDKNIVTSNSRCITITKPNVTLSCSNYSISQATPNHGTAIYENGLNNITINHCGIYGFDHSISISNSSKINIYNSTLKDYNPIKLSNLTYFYFINNSIKTSGEEGLNINTVSKSVIYDNHITGNDGTNGMVLNNSYINLIFNNTIYSNMVGFELENNSINNTIFNNTVGLSSEYDYECSPQASHIYSEYKGYNYGQKTNKCSWLSALSTSSPYASCYIVSNPTKININSDYLYRYGTVCMKIISNDVTLNCNNHTISALRGGTYVNVINSNNFKIENCYLQGFTSPIQVSNSAGSIIGNKVLIKKVDVSNAIVISNSPNVTTSENYIYNYSS